MPPLTPHSPLPRPLPLRAAGFPFFSLPALPASRRVELLLCFSLCQFIWLTLVAFFVLLLLLLRFQLPFAFGSLCALQLSVYTACCLLFLLFKYAAVFSMTTTRTETATAEPIHIYTIYLCVCVCRAEFKGLARNCQ